MSTSSLGAQLKVGIQMEPIQERVRKTTERLEADFSKFKTKIHRFPPGLRGIGNHYIIPSFVALGPYHHGSAHLLEAEELKHAAAHYFCSDSPHTLEQVYTKILSIAGKARGFYADDAVARFGDAEFAAMMFLDGCFVLHYINGFGLENSVWKNRTLLSTGPCMLRDIFLVENQIPWLVLDALITIRYVPVYRFVARMFLSFEASTGLSMDQFQRYSPPHLLGLLWYYQIGGRMVPQEHVDPRKSSSLGSSAFELAEIGVKLTAANKPWFVDMSFRRGHLFSELPLMPLFLNNVSACWLVNLAAFEACTSTSRWPADGFVVSSYLSLLAMLMDKEESVHELRAKHLLRSFFSDHEVLVFFKGLSHHLHLGNRYLVIAEKIEEFKRDRPVRIALHKFVYNNFKTMAALLSIASVLVGIFTTLMSLEQQQQQQH